jgi:hypothetical protein
VTKAGGKLGLLDAVGNLAEDALHYARSLAQWAWASFPVHSAKKTTLRFEICSGEKSGYPCDKFAGGKCSICGCPVKKNAACSSKTRPHLPQKSARIPVVQNGRRMY